MHVLTLNTDRSTEIFFDFIQSPMTKLYKKMFPVVLQLACDVERVNSQCHLKIYSGIIIMSCGCIVTPVVLCIIAIV